MSDMDEKRREPRFQSKQKVWCEGQDVKLSAEARDISLGGMALETGEPAEVGSTMKVSFAVPDGSDVSVNMEVVWRKEKPEGKRVAMGLRVVDFEKGKDAFNRFVASQAIESTSGTDKDKPKP